jgi:DNA-directed RNA polymerase specialized sigma subunit
MQMTNRELLENYRNLVIDISMMEQRLSFLSKYIGGPKPLHGVQLTGMPHGTNDPEAALLQQQDTDSEILEKIEQRMDETRRLTARFEVILESIDDRRTRNIVQAYYGLGHSEEKIAEEVGLSRQHVNRLRTAYIDGLV